jgi:hypothetical protein
MVDNPNNLGCIAQVDLAVGISNRQDGPVGRGRRPDLSDEERRDGVERFARLTARLGKLADVLKRLRPHLPDHISDTALRKQAKDGVSARVAEALKKLEAELDTVPRLPAAASASPTPRRAVDGRWRVYADSNLAFSEVATLALSEGAATEAQLDAASDRLQRKFGAHTPDEEQSKSAIRDVREAAAGWAKYQSVGSKKPGTLISAQQSRAARGSSTQR